MAKQTTTRRSPWLNPDGSLKTITFNPFTATPQPFTPASFIQNVERLEVLNDADKVTFSQEIFNDTSLESRSTEEFMKIRGGFNKDYIVPNFNQYLLANLPDIADYALQADPSKIERFMLNKHPKAKFAAFRLPVPQPNDPNAQTINHYNSTIDKKEVVHNEESQLEALGDDAYTHSKLGNLMQSRTDPMAIFIRVCEGSKFGDNSRVAQKLLDPYRCDFLESANQYGAGSVIPFIDQNIETGLILESVHKLALEQFEAQVEQQRKQLVGIGASEQELLNFQRGIDQQKQQFDARFQNAGEDAKYVTKGFADAAYKALK